MASQNYYYPQSGEPKTVHFSITGDRPTEEEFQRLTAIPFEKKPVSASEVKYALKWFAIGLIFSIVLWFSGRWVIRNFIGIAVWYVGYGGAYIAAPVSVIFAFWILLQIFRSGRKKKAKDSFNWIWRTSYFGDDSLNVRFGKLDYALDTLERAVPSGIPFDRAKIGDYITELRITMSNAMDETTLQARKEAPGGWGDSCALKSIIIDNGIEIYPGVLEICATITYEDVISRTDANDEKYNVISAILVLHIKSIFIKTGQYWYPYDLMPVISRVADPIEALSSGGDLGENTLVQ
jgi:hypothetical protein